MPIELDTGTDLMSLLDEINNEESSGSDPLADFTNGGTNKASFPSIAASGSLQAGGESSEQIPSSGGLASAPEDNGFDVEIPTEDQRVGTIIDKGPNPDDLDWPGYLQRFKEVFVKSKSLSEIELYAKNMSFKDYMDYSIKLMPKDVKIQGSVDFRHLVAELGPVDKEKYRLSGPVTAVHEVEFTEIRD